MEYSDTVAHKSRVFAIRIVHLYQHLTGTRKEYVMSKQLLRSGTSIGANIAECNCAFSKKDFLAKMYIAFKECSETRYWLTLLHDTDYLTDAEYQSVHADCTELYKMLAAITKTMRESDLE